MNVINFIKQKMIKAPWKKYYSKKDLKIKIDDKSIYQFLKDSAYDHLNADAIGYFGTSLTFRHFLKEIDRCAKAFKSQGIRKGDVVTICMPNTPEGIISFYAVSKIGAIANMIHPLSGEEEIRSFLVDTNSVMLVMIDVCYDKVKNVIKDTNVYKTIVVSARDSMPFLLGIGYQFTQGYKINKPKKSEAYMYWKDFMKKADKYTFEYEASVSKDDPAVFLHSGGTTGKPKTIVLTNGNFNSLSVQGKKVFSAVCVGDSVLAIMPIFHGFGLGISVNAPLTLGCKINLLPQFNARKFDKIIEKNKPNILFGVPTLYEALTNIKNEKLDLSFVKYIISGGDSLSSNLEKRINSYLREHGCREKVAQGYGMTESLAAVCVDIGESYKDGAIGIPLPGNYIKIVKPGTHDEVPYGEDGEICIYGPTVMLGYLDNEKETNEMLQMHRDGAIWLHTGDMGMMDEDGVVFYRQRIKRMIITSGYNVYPSHVESVIGEHPAVLNCSVVGVPHPYKVEVANAYIVLRNGFNPLTVKKDIKDYCKKNLAAYAVPYEFEFRKSLPKTLLNKVDFKKLQEEARKESENKSNEG